MFLERTPLVRNTLLVGAAVGALLAPAGCRSVLDTCATAEVQMGDPNARPAAQRALAEASEGYRVTTEQRSDVDEKVGVLAMPVGTEVEACVRQHAGSSGGPSVTVTSVEVQA